LLKLPIAIFPTVTFITVSFSTIMLVLFNRRICVFQHKLLFFERILFRLHAHEIVTLIFLILTNRF
jgi:hypothetical protein